VSATPRLQFLARKFDRLSLRERLFVVAAGLTVLIAAFNVLLMNRLDARRVRLSQELTGLESGMKASASAATTALAADSTGAEFAHAAELQDRLNKINAELNSRAAGMIAPQRMAEVIHDVLSHQHGVVLVSLRKLATIEIPPRTAGETRAAAPHPCIHTVELVLDGPYLDVLAYLQALEALPWRFYWRHLELTTTRYPQNRVRVELGTISMDSAWMDL
jgi:MSHA biogenesis protein MshJ